VSSSGVVEPVDVLEDGGLGLAPRWPGLPPQHLGLQRFEEGFDGGIEAPIFVKRRAMQVQVDKAC
jgi:hypothetical protein